MKYHVNEAGEVNPCQASVQDCRFGDFMGEHFPTKTAAQAAYSSRVENLLERAGASEVSAEKAAAAAEAAAKVYAAALKNGSSEKDVERAFGKLRIATLAAGRAERERILYAHEKGVMGLEEFTPPPQPKFEYPYKFNTKIFYPTRWGKMEFHGELPENLKNLLAKELAAFSEWSLSEAYEKVAGYEAYVEEERGAGREPLGRDAHVVALFQEGARNQKRDRVFIDLETTGFDPKVGEIIEIGVVRISPEGEVRETYEERFDMDSPAYREAMGTGAEFIHKIGRADIAGKRTFAQGDAQKAIAKLLNDPDVIIGAHNDSFERRYLNLHLEGFWKARSHTTERQKEVNPPMQDTMLISSFLEHSTPNNKLESFAEGNGVPYENAHSAFADAHMSALAYVNFRKKLMAMPLGVRPGLG